MKTQSCTLSFPIFHNWQLLNLQFWWWNIPNCQMSVVKVDIDQLYLHCKRNVEITHIMFQIWLRKKSFSKVKRLGISQMVECNVNEPGLPISMTHCYIIRTSLCNKAVLMTNKQSTLTFVDWELWIWHMMTTKLNKWWLNFAVLLFILIFCIIIRLGK